MSCYLVCSICFGHIDSFYVVSSLSRVEAGYDFKNYFFTPAVTIPSRRVPCAMTDSVSCWWHTIHLFHGLHQTSLLLCIWYSGMWRGNIWVSKHPIPSHPLHWSRVEVKLLPFDRFLVQFFWFLSLFSTSWLLYESQIRGKRGKWHFR